MGVFHGFNVSQKENWPNVAQILKYFFRGRRHRSFFQWVTPLLASARPLARRNKVPLCVATGVVAALAIGGGVAVWQAVNTRRVLSESQATAPALGQQARALAVQGRFDDAIDKLTYAASLRPDFSDYHLTKADLLRSQLRFTGAAASYRAALRAESGHRSAAANATLCDELAGCQAVNHGEVSEDAIPGSGGCE
jgi:tetratricopeptide (TPR) repeat protein